MTFVCPGNIGVVAQVFLWLNRNQRFKYSRKRGLLFMRVRVMVGLILVLTMLLSGCGGGKFKPDTMSMDDIGIMKIDDKNAKVYHGMTRSEAEKILGTGSKESFYIGYDFGVGIMYRMDQENNEETVAWISLNEDSGKVYSTIRGAKVGDLKGDVMKLHGEKYSIPILKVDRDIGYYYDLKTNKFMEQGSLSNRNKEDSYQQIGTDFVFNDDELVERIMLFDMHMAIYFH